MKQFSSFFMEFLDAVIIQELLQDAIPESILVTQNQIEFVQELHQTYWQFELIPWLEALRGHFRFTLDWRSKYQSISEISRKTKCYLLFLEKVYFNCVQTLRNLLASII